MEPSRELRRRPDFAMTDDTDDRQNDRRGKDRAERDDPGRSRLISPNSRRRGSHRDSRRGEEARNLPSGSLENFDRHRRRSGERQQSRERRHRDLKEFKGRGRGASGERDSRQNRDRRDDRRHLRDQETSGRDSRRGRSRNRDTAKASRPTLSSKRPRSRSPSPSLAGSGRKRLKKEVDLSVGVSDDGEREAFHARSRGYSPPHRRPRSRPRRRSLSHSGSPPRPRSRHTNPCDPPYYEADSQPHRQSDLGAPQPEFVRHRSTSPNHRRPATSSSTRSHENPDSEASAPNLVPVASLNAPSRSRHTREKRRRNGSRPPGPISGANSVEVNMSRRGGGYQGPMHAGYGSKQQYGGDPRYSQSPQHQSPAYHGSPPPQPGYGANRGGWSNNQSYSSTTTHHPPQFPQQGNHGPPTGPQSHYASKQINSSTQPSPPYSAPTGPSAQLNASGNSRGPSFRGGSTFRPNQFSSARGGFRASNFRSTQWSSANQVVPSRPHNSAAEDPTPTSQPDVEIEMSDQPAEAPASDQQDDPYDVDSRPSDTAAAADQISDDAVPPPRQPPTGPGAMMGGGSKFSFAFNKSTKQNPAGPKLEISQKFNAAPQRRTSFPDDHRDREFVRQPPTEPSSSRARQHQREPGSQPPPPKPTLQPPNPRVRLVKKIAKRPLPRPVLDPELAQSESVFFRKPGDGSVVGSGTYGKVFKGLHVYTKSYVALKRIRMEGEKDGFPVTAIREIKLLQSLKHENIVRLQEVMVEANNCFMVFEYLSHDLTGILNHPSFKLDDSQRKHMSMQLFQGLDYLHKRGVLHRDLKAANILVSNVGILKLADFGLARFFDKKRQNDYTNRVVTIWYRSPDLLLGETKYDASIDIWSAACVMYEIFTGRALFPGDGTEVNQLDLIFSVFGSPRASNWPGWKDTPWFFLINTNLYRRDTFAEKCRDRVSEEGMDLLCAMFSYDPAQRPSAAEVLEHPYFITEEPRPAQAVELAQIQGEWHELEFKALRKKGAKEKAAREKESREREQKEKDRKRVRDAAEPPSQREFKRVHVESNSEPSERASSIRPAPTAV